MQLDFDSLKIKRYFSCKDSIHDDLKPFLVYIFTCASCSSSYNGETCRYFKTRIEEHIKKDNKSHICKHLHTTTTCFNSYISLFFKIIGKALHIIWTKRNLNAQQNPLVFTLSL